MEMVVVAYQWPYPGDGGVIKKDNLDKAEFKKYTDQPSRCTPIVLRVKPCYSVLHFVFAK